MASKTTSKPSDDAPIVVDAKDKDSERFSNQGLRDATLCHDTFVDTAQTLANGLAAGIQDYSKRSADSAEKSRDGAILDAVANFAGATGKTLEEWSKAPEAATKPLRESERNRQSAASLLTAALLPCAVFGEAVESDEDDD